MFSCNTGELYAPGALEGYTTMGKKIYVGNLPFTMGEADLKELFEQQGAVDSVTVMRDVNSGRSRGFAFVEMTSEEDATKAIEELNSHSIDGRSLTVNEAKPKVERRRGGSSGRGNKRGHNRESRW